MRLDLYLSGNGLCKSRTAAQELIKSGGVSINGSPCLKSSQEIIDGDTVEITGEQLRYVSRGGLKLEKALSEFSISVNGLVCADLGASSGGFTDCMLQNGASKVFAVDVGKGQLDEKLRADSRVVSMEQTDIRNAVLPRMADFIGTDVSFISLKLIIPHIYRLLKPSGTAVALIKPQFEAGRAGIGKGGIVKDEKVRLRVVEEITAFARESGFEIRGTVKSPITGGDGNIEYLMCLFKAPEDKI